MATKAKSTTKRLFVDPTLIKRAEESELNFAMFCGLEYNTDIQYSDVKISYNGDPHYIHTFICNKEEEITENSPKPNLVLLHGYGAASIYFYKMLPLLSKAFTIYGLDHLGMGLSSRPEFKLETSQETLDYFVEAVEKWRQAMNIEKFYLLGHSLGGYIAPLYAMKYPSRVEEMVLLSPIGISEVTGDAFGEEARSTNIAARLVAHFQRGFWEKKLTHNYMYRNYGILGRMSLKHYIQMRFKDKIEANIFHQFYSSMFAMPESAELAVHNILKPISMDPHIPVADMMIEKLQFPIHFYFGDKDWMNPEGAKKVCENSKANCTLTFIENAGHDINVQNPVALVRDMLKKLAFGRYNLKEEDEVIFSNIKEESSKSNPTLLSLEDQSINSLSTMPSSDESRNTITEIEVITEDQKSSVNFFYHKAFVVKEFTTKVVTSLYGKIFVRSFDF